jgi:general secretion pathway protein F
VTAAQEIFEYQALTAAGSRERGTLDAPSAEDARAQLRRRGLFVVGVVSRGPRRERRTSMPGSDLALGLRILADLLESGLPLARALNVFDDLAPRAWRAALPFIREQVREGKGLAAALADAPVRVPPLVIGIVQAGEAGTGVGAAVRRAADLTDAAAQIRSAFWSALAYPLVVALAGAGAITVLIAFVLPRFAKILADLGQTLPASTQLVLRGASAAHAAFLPGALAVAVTVVLWRAWTNTRDGAVRWHRLLLRVPGLGGIRARLSTARVGHSLSALLDSGIPMSAALAFAARAAGDSECEARILSARSLVVSGVSLSSALERTRAVTPTAIKLARAGEEAGRLASMLSHAARIEQQSADQTARVAIRMLEPLLLLGFACAVALIAAALLQAIYSIRPVA